MEPKTQPSYAAIKRSRVRVISPPALLGVTVLVLATLVLIFPRDDLINSLRERRPHSEDALGATYGAAVLKSIPDPKDDVLRIVVAERQFGLAELPEARKTLAPLKESADVKPRREAGLLDHRVLRLMIEHEEAGSPGHRQAIEELKRLLDWMSHESWDPPSLLAFAREAVALGLDDTASRFYRRLIESGTVRSEILEEAVRHALGRGNYEAAADLYFEAMAKAGTLAERRRLFRKGVETLIAGNMMDKALAAADRHLGELAQDEPTLRFLITAATAADLRGRVLALRYHRMLFEMGGMRPDLLEAAVRHALSLGQYTVAAEYYFIARHRTQALTDRRRYFRQGIETLRSGTLLTQAFDAAETHLGDLADDEPTLRFMVQFALGANDQVRAQDFSRRLIRLSNPPALTSKIERVGQGVTLVAVVPVVAPVERMLVATLDLLIRSAHAQPAITTRPYTEESYRLAFDVFIANSNFADARRVAEAALEARPDDLDWRTRLIRVAEWSGDALEALRQWKIIAARRPSREVYEAILRLAPGLGDEEALLDAWRFMANARALTRQELETVVTVFENLGRSEQAIAWLRELDARGRRADYLELIALTAERSGRPDLAIATLLELEKRAGLSLDQAMTLATLYFAQGNFIEALRALTRVAPKATDQDYGYWRLVGDLAWRLGDDQAAADAYGKLDVQKQLEPFEFVRLLRILRETQAAQAARLAEAGWRERRDPELFMLAAEFYASRRDRRALERLFASVRAVDEGKFANNPYFFIVRSRFQLERGFAREAIADWRRALAIRPGDVELRTGLIFLLVETRSIDELRLVISAWRGESIRDRGYWPAFAAGYQALNEPRNALPYYRLALVDRPDDYLWLLGFADALEDAAEGGMAWRIRRHAWHAIRAKRAEDPKLLEVPEELLGYARLATRMAPGDQDMAVIRQVLKQGLIGSPNPALDATARELVLAWAITAEQAPNAKAWMWTQYGRRLARPAYAEIAIALAENDLETMERLLSRSPEALPRYDRLDAARETRMTRLGQSLGWASQGHYPADDDIHLRLEQDLRRSSHSVIAHASWGRFGSLHYREEGIALSYWLTPNVRLEPGLKLTHQHMANDTDLVNVPRLDRTESMTAEWHTRHTQTTAVASHRSALADVNAFRIGHTRRFNSRVAATIEIGRNQYAPETAALRVGGMKDEMRVSATYDLSKREYLTLGAATQRYMTQARTLAGNGRRIEAETGYRIRTDYPNLTARLYAAHHGLSSTASTDNLGARINPAGDVPAGSLFVPNSFSYYAAAIGFGEFLRRDYSRAIRPFADTNISYNTVTGNGFGATIGVGGTVLGSDHLSIGYTRSRGGTGVNVTSEELALRYQFYF